MCVLLLGARTHIPSAGTVTHDEIVDVVIGVGVARLQSEHRGVGRRVQLDHGLHGKRTIDEVGRLVVDVLDVDDDALVIGICGVVDWDIVNKLQLCFFIDKLTFESSWVIGNSEPTMERENK